MIKYLKDYILLEQVRNSKFNLSADNIEFMDEVNLHSNYIGLLVQNFAKKLLPFSRSKEFNYILKRSVQLIKLLKYI